MTFLLITSHIIKLELQKGYHCVPPEQLSRMKQRDERKSSRDIKSAYALLKFLSLLSIENKCNI